MPPKPKCMVRKCRVRKKSAMIPLPPGESAVHKIWVKVCGHEDDFDETLHTHVCKGHFTEEDLCPSYTYMLQMVPHFNGPVTLKSSAVPSLHLPGKGKSGADPPSKKQKPNETTAVCANKNKDFLNWSEVSNISMDQVEVPQTELDASYKPSDSSIQAAQEEGYYEHEEMEEEDTGNLQEDVADIDVNIESGYILMDVGILNDIIGHSVCHKCKKSITKVQQKRFGAMLAYHVWCVDGHKEVIRTQNITHHQPEGNVALSNAIFCSGMTFTSWTRLCLALNFLSIGPSTYYAHLEKFVKPAVISTWTKARTATFEAIKSTSEKLICVCDGQFDSVGYCAKYLVETIMCAMTGRIIDFVIFQKKLFPGEMEAKGLRFLLLRIKKKFGDIFEILCTDRNKSVRKVLREEFPEIEHEFDIWHLAKSLKKKMKLVFKGSKVLMGWSKSIVNHIWWCSQTCGGCAVTMLQKWTSCALHIRNNHSQCEHPPIAAEISKQKAWVINPGEVKKLNGFVHDKALLKDMEHCTNYVHTGNLESVHSKANIYRPKKHHFSYQGMVLRTCIAYIDHNNNLNKKVVKEVSEYSKETGQWMTRKVYEKNDYKWLTQLASLVMCNLRKPCIEISSEENELMFPFNLPKNIAPVPKVPVEVLQQKSVSRF